MWELPPLQPTAFNSLWTAIMGSSYTLTDLVAGVLGGLSTVVSTVKAGVSVVWDGIKSGASFILKDSFRTILETFSVTFNSILKASLMVISAVFGVEDLIDISGALPTVDGIEMGLSFIMDDLEFKFGSGIGLYDLFGQMRVETLGLRPEMRNYLLTYLGFRFSNIFYTSTFSFLSKNPAKTVDVLFLWLISQYAFNSLSGFYAINQHPAGFAEVNLTHETVQKYEFFGALHFGWFVMMLINVVIGFVMGKVIGLAERMGSFLNRVSSWLGLVTDRLTGMARVFETLKDGLKIVGPIFAQIFGDFIIDIFLDNWYRDFYRLIVKKPYLDQTFYLWDEDLTGLKVGMYMGLIEDVLVRILPIGMEGTIAGIIRGPYQISLLSAFLNLVMSVGYLLALRVHEG